MRPGADDASQISRQHFDYTIKVRKWRAGFAGLIISLSCNHRSNHRIGVAATWV